jgi:hypothetical protein
MDEIRHPDQSDRRADRETNLRALDQLPESALQHRSNKEHQHRADGDQGTCPAVCRNVIDSGMPAREENLVGDEKAGRSAQNSLLFKVISIGAAALVPAGGSFGDRASVISTRAA